MFFSLSKIFWIVFSPLTFIGLLLLIGSALLVFTKGRRGRCIAGLGAALFLICGFLPIGTNLLVFLERQYTAPAPMPETVDGIIILGGAVNAERSQAQGQVAFNGYVERLTTMVELSRSYPQARIIYSGGTARLLPGEAREADEVKKLLQNMGVLTDRYEFETTSRNTYENMARTRELVHPQDGEKWLLVTSAFHMLRSVGIFQKAGWAVIPYPAGYLTNRTYAWPDNLDVLGNFYKLQVATKEIVGIIAYSLTGKL